MEAALRLLEKEGLLVPQGAGRRRRIRLPEDGGAPSLRVAILAGEPADRAMDYMVELQHELAEAGHSVVLRAEVPDGARAWMWRASRGWWSRTEADAWVVVAGSREVLEWFAERRIPVFALFGRRRGLPIAGVGPDKAPAIAAATRRLIGLGHRRIVLLARRMRRLPEPGAVERAFLDELAAHGIAPGPYHLPDWEESIDGFHERLESLFQITPPTALIVDEAPFFVAAQQFLRGAGAAGAGGRFAGLHRCRPGLRLVPAVGRPHPLGQPPGGAAGRALGGQREPRQGRTCARRSPRRSSSPAGRSGRRRSEADRSQGAGLSAAGRGRQARS